MGQSLIEIAQTLRDTNKKVQLIYAFNGVGKTRLSREFKKLIDQKDDTDGADQEELGPKILYYNAYTEDLFYWDNDLDGDTERKLQIQPNEFTNTALNFLKDESQDGNIAKNFQHFTTPSLTPKFSEDYSEVRFSIQRGDDSSIDNIKISRGEESNFIWCVFYSLIEQIISVLNAEIDNRSTHKFDGLKYIFVDDPVSSLDDNHLIELAVNLAKLIKGSYNLNFVISTHNPLFYNILYNELNIKNKRGCCYMLAKNEDGTFELKEKLGDSNKSFSYHLFLKHTIKEAIDNNNIQKYHFTLLRNLYEKTANFLEYPQWSDLLPDDKQAYYNRIIQFTSHSTLSNEEVAEPTGPERQTVKLLYDHLTKNYNYWEEEQNDTV